MTGVFDDVSHERTLFTSNCNCVGAPAWQPAIDESLDVDQMSYTVGGTSGNALKPIDLAQMPTALVGGGRRDRRRAPHSSPEG